MKHFEHYDTSMVEVFQYEFDEIGMSEIAHQIIKEHPAIAKTILEYCQ